MTQKDDSVTSDQITRINRAIDYIRNHCAEDLDLERVSRVACLSRYHFHRIFHQVTGETINRFIRRTRLEKSILMLSGNSEASVTTVAHECGFSSSQNFAKVFKTHFGISPTTVRDKMGWSAYRDLMADPKDYVAFLDRAVKDQPQLMDLASYLKAISQRNSQGRAHCHPRIVNIKDFPVAYIRTWGNEPSLIHKAFDELFGWAMYKGLINERSSMLFVLWNDPFYTPKEQLIIDICLTVTDEVEAESPVTTQVLPGGKFAVLHCETFEPAIEEEWIHFIFSWAPASGYRPLLDSPKYTFIDNKTFQISDMTKPHAERMAAVDLHLPIA